jgi:DNA-binding transcriptional LysR family regulator
MDRLEAMEVFLAAVEGGSLSSAGRKLGMPLTTVSRKISDLERHLNARLLERSTRKVMPTNAGLDFVAACRAVLQSVQEAERTAAGEYTTPRGDLTVTAPICFGRMHVLPVINAFLERYSDVDVRLILSDGDCDLQEDRIDVAVRIMHLPDSSLVATRIAYVRPLVCASPSYLDRAGRPVTPHDLAQHACIATGSALAPTPWSFRIDGSDVKLPVRPRLVATTSEAAIDAAIASVGVTQTLCCQTQSARADGLLEVVLGTYEAKPLPVNFVYRRRDRVPMKLRSFLDFAGPRLRQRLNESGAMPRTRAPSAALNV